MQEAVKTIARETRIRVGADSERSGQIFEAPQKGLGQTWSALGRPVEASEARGRFGLALAPTSLVTVPAARLQFMPPVTVQAARHCPCRPSLFPPPGYSSGRPSLFRPPVTVQAARHCSGRPSLFMPPVTGHAAHHWSCRPSLVMPPVTDHAARHCSCRPSLLVPPVTARAARHCSCRPSLLVPPVTARAARHCSCRPSLLVPPVTARAARHCSCRPISAPAARHCSCRPVTVHAARLPCHAMSSCSFPPLLVSALARFCRQ
ncbi:unnamed protein product [Closterium sp. NIES-65]|nr:unnamed protein product [Closterium sp. NIES-65]